MLSEEQLKELRGWLDDSCMAHQDEFYALLDEHRAFKAALEWIATMGRRPGRELTDTPEEERVHFEKQYRVAIATAARALRGEHA